MATLLEPEQTRAIERRIEKVYELPPMPELGRRILELQSDPNASALQLANIVQLDPSLAAQVVRYASSSYYGYKGRITNIQEAISRVLGYDMVLNLALGLAAGRSFRIPDAGPLGLSKFWEHAVCNAILVQRIGAMLPKSLRPEPGLSYLCGLLHDLGKVVFFKIDPTNYSAIFIAGESAESAAISAYETEYYGMDHAAVGEKLAKQWRLPPELSYVISKHHDSLTAETKLVSAVSLADLLAKKLQIGYDGDNIIDVEIEKLQSLLNMSSGEYEQLEVFVSCVRKQIEDFFQTSY